MENPVLPSSPNKFKNDSGAWLLKALFFETTLADKSQVVYTLKDEDHEGYPSLYKLYLDTGDITEYEFASLHLGGWDHWCRLQKCSWFTPYLERWREELRLKLKAKALRGVISEAQSSSRNAFAANKFLVQEGWKEPEKSKRGRPSKAEIDKERDKLLEFDAELKEAKERLNLN